MASIEEGRALFFSSGCCTIRVTSFNVKSYMTDEAVYTYWKILEESPEELLKNDSQTLDTYCSFKQ